MALPPARTNDEAHVYMNLHPCPDCGGVEVDWRRTRVMEPDGPLVRYAGTCRCGTGREFVFAEPEQPEHELRLAIQPATGSAKVILFGGRQPSRLIDAGEWLLISDVSAQAGDLVDGAPADAASCESLWIAVAALTEVLKFVPPHAREVPESAFWTERGRAVRRRAHTRFDRDRLLSDRDNYRHLLDRGPMPG